MKVYDLVYPDGDCVYQHVPEHSKNVKFLKMGEFHDGDERFVTLNEYPKIKFQLREKESNNG